MLQKILGKNVEIGVAFNGGIANFAGTPLGGTKYYSGVVSGYDENFIMIDNGYLIGLKYIQTIKVL